MAELGRVSVPVGIDPADPDPRHPNRPQRKWFAAAAGALVVQLLAGIGVDVGELGSSLLDVVGISQDPDAVEAATRTAIGALAMHYAWPEYLKLPDAVRNLLRLKADA